ncbi:MAG TPA: 2-oxo-4-hydroxy-4-carboxy-5-ureidoimidazoline decarboxylase [Ktedonobacterales bacterium]|nr:2-oxo-4-hydroxy-4-carboxy-5-ureidoimidazoline decarboxylase [Ktedonobacterales bacterium]
MLPAPLTLATVNALDRDAFVATLGGLFEGPPWIVARAWDRRPFASRAALYQALCAVMRAALEEEQVALLQAHPDLVGRAALAGTLSTASAGEQAAAGLDALTPDEIATFQRLNQEYRARFGFPFVICARANRKASILAGFARRLGNTRAEEIAAALGEVEQICALRLTDMVATE